MVEITRQDNYTFDDCNSNSYAFRTKNLVVNFYQAGNRDLYFTCFPRSDQKTNQIKINLYEDYLLYSAIDELYKDLTDLTRWEYISLAMENNQRKLFNGEYISWESDDYCSMYEADGEKRYNYLNIYKTATEYILEFVNNSDRGIYSIVFNTDRSKYQNFVCSFVRLLTNLKQVTEKYHQIDLDEYMVLEKIKNK